MPPPKRKKLYSSKSLGERGLKALKEAQERLQVALMEGRSETELRAIMLGIGFGSITPAQFLAAESLEDFFQLLDDQADPKSN